MAKINTKVETFEVTHPKHKDLIVEVIDLEPIEAMDMFAGMQKYTKVVVLTHPESGEVLYDKDENPITKEMSQLPAKAILEILEKTLKGWTGLEDEKAKVIPFKPENLKYLFSRDLNVATVRKVKENGKEVDKPGTMSFADYIQAEINKRVKAKEDEAVPKTKS